MFLESLVETSRDTRARRGFATMVSFALEAVAVGAMVLFPLIYTQALPGLRFSEPVPPPPAARPKVPEEMRTTLVKVPAELQNDGVIREPSEIPRDIYIPKEPEVAPPQVGNSVECVGCIEGGVGEPNERPGNTLLTSLFKPVPVEAAPREVVPKAIRVSVMDPGMLISRVEPQYPHVAKITRTQGEVVLVAVIGRDGRIQNLRTLSGHPYLVGAAMDAVRQWRYRPTVLNGQPVEVETQITVRFTLAVH
ncbi:MAG TPA: energy transducer TonB [Terriglobales bacterium]|nr:energy transducer TonB [Terriglobales bacterium]